MLEERLVEQGTSPDAAPAHAQYVWSPVYVDAMILRDRDADNDSLTGDRGVDGSSLEERVYALQDANFNVTALVGYSPAETAWGVIERYVHDPYGTPTVLHGAEGFDPDVNGSTVHEWDADTTGSDVDFLYGHQGGRAMWEGGKVDFRNRFLLTGLGRWGQVDPLGYVDGSSLYLAYSANPATFVDPEGTNIFRALLKLLRGGKGKAKPATPVKGKPAATPIPRPPRLDCGLSPSEAGRKVGWGVGEKGARDATKGMTKDRANEIVKEVPKGDIKKLRDWYCDVEKWEDINMPDKVVRTPKYRVELLDKILELAD